MSGDEEKRYTVGYGLAKLASAIGGLGCLVAAIWLWQHGFNSWWVILLGVFGALSAL